ncbi:DMP19 family protein [Tenacibaculum halocynthiae]|uniref:DMP19 family protein n=1 Tax=Tenacibaculum halocynthiae TaxID=1254437 RepID=UPI0038933A6C
MANREIIDNYYNKAVENLNENIISNYKHWNKYVENLSEKQKATYLISIFHDQVFNGGFHQYFLNPYGCFSYQTLSCLKKIKAKTTANLLLEVLSVVNYLNLDVQDFSRNIFNRELNRITNFDDLICDSLDGLDDKYYNSKEDLVKLLANYLTSDGASMSE